jgi:hypothetical protein
LFNPAPTKWKFPTRERSLTRIRTRPAGTDEALRRAAPEGATEALRVRTIAGGGGGGGGLRVGNEKRPVHRLPVRFAGVRIDGVVPERDRKALLPHELDIGSKVDRRVAVARKVEVVEAREILDDDRVRPGEQAAYLFAGGVVQRDVEAVVRAYDGVQRRSLPPERMPRNGRQRGCHEHEHETRH